MKLEDQVTSLELSKRLKELGIEQKSLFYWSKLSIQTEYKLELRQNIFNQEWVFADCSDYISAFTASELLALLPVGVYTNNAEPFSNYRISIWKSLLVLNPNDMKISHGYHINYECDTHLATDHAWDKRFLTKNQWDENPANAFAKMLIYLYENGLMKNE